MLFLHIKFWWKSFHLININYKISLIFYQEYVVHVVTFSIQLYSLKFYAKYTKIFQKTAFSTLNS